MASEEFKRKLSAILSADVEGHSRLMGDDEDAIFRAIAPIFETMGDFIAFIFVRISSRRKKCATS